VKSRNELWGSSSGSGEEGVGKELKSADNDKAG